MKPANYPTQPEYLWNIFYDFSQTPRPSKKEDKIREYLVQTAQNAQLKYHVDEAGNVIIYVPGKNGREQDAPLLIQNHIDMVTDALHTKKINFETDPIELLVDGNWVKANGTTLGADNGIGCAAALATIFDQSLVHPPLELLFTVDEETGLNGALGLESKYLSAKKMLNLDTEEWGSLYIGCAGGIDYELTRDMQTHAPKHNHLVKLQIEGFIGGHSGCDIHQQRGNAIKFLAEILEDLRQKTDFELAEIRGGKAHNIIPRDAFAILAVDETKENLVRESANTLMNKWKSFMPENDQKFSFKILEVDQDFNVLNQVDRDNVIDYLLLFPHGAHAYDLNARDIVSMSNNLARFLLVNGKFYTQTSLRFFDRNEVVEIEKKLEILGKIYQLKVESHSEYPSWKPTPHNPVLEQVKECYRDLYQKDPVVTAIHAGLECGILRDKIGPVDVVSFGPTILGAHSPDERVDIESVTKFWELFKNVLAKI